MNVYSRRDFFKKITGVAAITATDASAHAERPRAPGSRPAVEAISDEAIRNHKQSVQSRLFQFFPRAAHSADGRRQR